MSYNRVTGRKFSLFRKNIYNERKENRRMKGYSATEAIYAKCLDCCCNDLTEVKNCPITKCPLYPWHTKCVKHRDLTEEQRQAMRDRYKARFKNN